MCLPPFVIILAHNRAAPVLVIGPRVETKYFQTGHQPMQERSGFCISVN